MKKTFIIEIELKEYQLRELLCEFVCSSDIEDIATSTLKEIGG